MLKEESLIHYEASFCYDAFQFCVLVSRSLAALGSLFTRDADPHFTGVRLHKRKGVDTAGLGGLLHHVWSRQ